VDRVAQLLDDEDLTGKALREIHKTEDREIVADADPVAADADIKTEEPASVNASDLPSRLQSLRTR